MTAAIIPFPAARRAAPPQPKPVYTQWRIGDMISFYDVAENEHRGNISTLYDPGIYAEFLIAVVTCDDGINRRAHLPESVVMKDLFGNTTSLRDIQGEDYAGRIITETTDAILFNEGEKEVWLPLSHIRISNLRPAPKGERGQLAIVTIPDWLARKKGLIEGDGP